MWNNETIIWVSAGAAVLLLVALWLRKRAARARPAEAEERAPAPVEGSTAFTGVHKGVKYWVYFENNKARLEIEAGEAVAAPFMADRRAGAPVMPGDARDAEVLELFKLRADYVEASAAGNLITAQFPESVINAYAGKPYPPVPDEAASNKAAEQLAGIREKTRGQAAGTPQP
jgi:hypothetical protein